MRRNAARSAGPKLMPWMRGEAAAISSRFETPSEVSRIAWMRIGRSIPAFASSCASRRSTKWMSHGPSTFGIIITSSLWPISPTSCVMSSSTHGDSSEFTRVHSWVSPRSMSRPTLMSPARAPSLRSTGTASSRLPSSTSTVGAMSGTFATIFSLEKSRKWIIRAGRTGISRTGSGASRASGLKKSRGLRIRAGTLRGPLGRLDAVLLGHRGGVCVVTGELAAHVELADALVAPVHHEDVARAQQGAAVRRAVPGAVRVGDPEHDDALVAQVQLAEAALGQPVAALDLKLGDTPVTREAQQPGEVARIEAAPAVQSALDGPFEDPRHAMAPGQQPQDGQPDPQDGEPHQRTAPVEG